jgi:hypothetical protein
LTGFEVDVSSLSLLLGFAWLDGFWFDGFLACSLPMMTWAFFSVYSSSISDVCKKRRIFAVEPSRKVSRGSICYVRLEQLAYVTSGADEEGVDEK